MSTPRDPYVCPDCGDRAPVATTCPRCDVPLVDSRLLDEEARDQHPVPLSLVRSTPLLVALLVLPLVASLFVDCYFGPAREHADAHGMVLLSAILTTPLALLLGLRSRRSAYRAHVARARRRLDAAAPVRVAEAAHAAAGATVRVAGRATIVRAARTPEGVRCVAYQKLSVDHERSASLRSRGALFDLEDEAGNRVRVRADHVVIAGDATDQQVPPGARVEVLGVAREVIAGDVIAAGPRATARITEIAGTAEAPVVLRALDADPASPAGVRVDVRDASVLAIGAAREQLDALDAPPARAAGR